MYIIVIRCRTLWAPLSRIVTVQRWEEAEMLKIFYKDVSVYIKYVESLCVWLKYFVGLMDFDVSPHLSFLSYHYE